MSVIPCIMSQFISVRTAPFISTIQNVYLSRVQLVVGIVLIE